MRIEPVVVSPQTEADNEALIAWLVEKDIPFTIDYSDRGFFFDASDDGNVIRDVKFVGPVT